MTQVYGCASGVRALLPKTQIVSRLGVMEIVYVHTVAHTAFEEYVQRQIGDDPLLSHPGHNAPGEKRMTNDM